MTDDPDDILSLNGRVYSRKTVRRLFDEFEAAGPIRLAHNVREEDVVLDLALAASFTYIHALTDHMNEAQRQLFGQVLCLNENPDDDLTRSEREADEVRDEEEI